MLVRFVGAAALALGLFVSPASAQDNDVLAPARAGQLQCFEPNIANKTCASLGGYSFGADGVILNAAEILIMPSPAILMRVTAPVTVRANAVCGPLSAADIDRATFTINGAPATAEETTQIKAAMQQQLGPMIGVESCMTLTPDGDVLRADTVLGGTPRPDMSQRVIWVGANEGYRVAP